MSEILWTVARLPSSSLQRQIRRHQPGRGALIETGILQERFGERVIYLVENGSEFGPMAENFARESFTQDNLERAFHRIVVELKACGLI